MQPFNLRLARYKKQVVAVHGDGNAAWRMTAPYTPGPTSPLVNPDASNWGKEKPTPGGTTNQDDNKNQFQDFTTDEERRNKINDVEAPPEKLYKLVLKPGHQMTPELAKEVKDWKSENGTMYLIVDSPERVEEIRRRVPNVIIEERGE